MYISFNCVVLNIDISVETSPFLAQKHLVIFPGLLWPGTYSLQVSLSNFCDCLRIEDVFLSIFDSALKVSKYRKRDRARQKQSLSRRALGETPTVEEQRALFRSYFRPLAISSDCHATPRDPWS